LRDLKKKRDLIVKKNEIYDVSNFNQDRFFNDDQFHFLKIDDKRVYSMYAVYILAFYYLSVCFTIAICLSLIGVLYMHQLLMYLLA